MVSAVVVNIVVETVEVVAIVAVVVMVVTTVVIVDVLGRLDCHCTFSSLQQRTECPHFRALWLFGRASCLCPSHQALRRTDIDQERLPLWTS